MSVIDDKKQQGVKISNTASVDTDLGKLKMPEKPGVNTQADSRAAGAAGRELTNVAQAVGVTTANYDEQFLADLADAAMDAATKGQA